MTQLRPLDRHVFLTRVLDPDTLAARADLELSRAERYARELAVVVFELPGQAQLPAFAVSLARRVRRWDLVGWLEHEPARLVVVLPETGRRGAQGLLGRLGSLTQGVQARIAAAP